MERSKSLRDYGIFLFALSFRMFASCQIRASLKVGEQGVRDILHVIGERILAIDLASS
jgi:hypothetical protein